MSMRYPGGLIATSPVNARYPSGVWTQAQAAPYQSQNVWTRDRFWPNTTLLLQGDGATNGAQNNTFLDSSSNNFTITRNGNTTQGAFTPYEQDGYWSNYFDGTSAYLTAGSSVSLSGDFTVECWVYGIAYGANNAFYLYGLGNDLNSTGATFFINSSGQLRLFTSNANRFSGTAGAITLNTWNHVAFVRSSGTVKAYLNGISVDSSSSWTNTISGLSHINAELNGASPTTYIGGTCYISNFRVVTSAIYTSNFTPSTAPLTAITNTSLLTCQSNRFKDNSTNAFAITVNGSPSVQSFQPFPGATTWSASVLGGSGYFDGTGDYLSAADNAAWVLSGDFTIEAWVYPTVGGVLRAFIAQWPGSGGAGNQAFYLGISSTNYAQFTYGLGGSNINVTGTSASVITSQWNHIAVTRSGTSVKLFVNGVQDSTTATVSGSLNDSTGPLYIGCLNPTDGFLTTGYISNARLVNGTAVYTANFTPPTAPLTAITNTSLLLNFTNAGIYDNSMMNNLETVGNAQVSTSVVKYGTGSMAFDGSGDNLSLISQPPLYLSTGDFTIEMWLYTTTATTSQQVFIRRSSVTARGMAMTISGVASQKITFLAGDTNTSAWEVTLTSGTSLASNTWYHVAVTRNGSNFTLWLNGVSEATASSSVTIADDTSTFFIGVTDGSSAYLNGYLDDFRITKGVARYITSFTPPPARLPAQ